MQRTEFFLLRHGETAWNQAGRIQGQLDVALNPLGIRQARAAAARLRTLPLCTAVYASDLQRARLTAERVAESCGLPLSIHKALRERHFGILQGMLRNTVRETYPDIWQAYHNRPDYRIPLGESTLDLATRSVRFLETLAKRHPDEQVVVVTHGGVISSVLKHTLHMPQTHLRPFSCHNASLNVFTYSDRQGWQLEVWGDTHHLQKVS